MCVRSRSFQRVLCTKDPIYEVHSADLAVCQRAYFGDQVENFVRQPVDTKGVLVVHDADEM